MYTKTHAQQNKIMLAKAMQVVAQHYDYERDRDVFDDEYHSNMQSAVFAVIDELFDNISYERKRRLKTKAVMRHRGKLIRAAE